MVFGKQVGTKISAPLLIIKTKLYTKRVYTQLPCPSKDIVTHKPLPPIVVDITPYDQLLNNPNAPYDAVIMNVGGDFAFGGGTGGGLQIIGIVKGGFRGIYVYKPTMPNGNFGVAISTGLTLGFVDFNEKTSAERRGSLSILTQQLSRVTVRDGRGDRGLTGLPQ